MKEKHLSTFTMQSNRLYTLYTYTALEKQAGFRHQLVAQLVFAQY